MNEESNKISNHSSGWKLNLGLILFIFSILLPLLGIPVVTNMQLSTEVMATISGAFLVGAEIIGLIAIAVMGKSGYLYIKSKILVV